MSQIRRRKLRDVDSGSSGSHPGKKPRPAGKLHKTFGFVLIGLVTVTIFLGRTTFNPVVDHIASRLGYYEPVYAVVIDAGSTGSRVLAYTFHKTYLGGQLILEDELFKEIKPGLSSYVDNPNKGAESIMSLLDIARTVIPEEYRAETPILLRATAGLRLLDPTAADKLLDVVRQAINRSGFKVSRDSVDIMDGSDEGICSWFTVNFLQGKLSDDMTSAALDLGGGSTQITYEPHGSKAPSPIITLPGPSRNISLYTYSYLNLGLMAARRGVLLTENDEKASNVLSECINPLIKNNKWRYANTDYFVSGPQKNILYKEVKETASSVSERVPVVRLERCRGLISGMVKKLLPSAPNPSRLSDHHINAFSYYFDRAAEAGLIDPILGGFITVKDFIDASEKECSTANVDQPWACLDLTYISVLLQDAFQLAPNTRLQLVKKINGHEISWALGLAYNTLMNNSS
ncbi:ectonucleoside triphosphate diphosphohydrolase NTPase isoform X2 [Arctopsyche grandis]|uniref:ectonucleoside triphosphate diphosphohydrolase NTPase isoform X2 n=1 Tax=Arctopsyche grandis TaxID=121162 RepID=UPI00406D7654